MHQPLVSIIMPAYNAEKYIGQAIQSIIDQTYQNWELLICDDGSTDKTLREVYSFKDNRIKTFENKKNIGSLLTRNNLFKMLRGELVALHDADDFSKPERFKKQVDEFVKKPYLQLCGTWAEYVQNKRTVKFKNTPLSWNDIKDTISIKNAFCSASIMFRADLLTQIEPYRTYFKYIGNYDYDFTSRIVEKFPCINIPEYLYIVTVLSGSNSKVNIFDNLLKFESDRLVKELIKERESSGKDSLQEQNYESLRKLEDELLLPYKKDKWLVYDKVLNQYLELNFFKKAFNLVINCLLENPFSLKPYRFLIYSIRHYFK